MRVERFEGSESPERAAVIDNLRAYNRAQAGDARARSFTLAARAEDGALLGGLNAVLYWDWLFIDHLWVDESRRGAGVGSRLLREAEAHARAEGCRAAHLDTFSFQARGFYEKAGYREFGRLDECPAGQARHYFWKLLES
jgi:GNAT superfamily N-acetyltransferase